MILFTDKELSTEKMFKILSIVTAFLFGILYFGALFQMKKAEEQTLKLNTGERIIKEAIVLKRISTDYGKLWRTSERIVFKSIKNNYTEIPLSEILEEKNKKNFVEA